ncbi:UNVERIFIED_CONTAM: hypothetical protein FKN15_043366 [Acipenser sinensis]
MGRKSCRKQRKEQLVPQAAVATPLPPLPPGSPPSREIWDWLVHPEGNFAFDLPALLARCACEMGNDGRTGRSSTTRHQSVTLPWWCWGT